MYELGFPQKYFGPSEPWAEAVRRRPWAVARLRPCPPSEARPHRHPLSRVQMKLAAADLFDLVAVVVERFVKELTAKAAAL